MDPSGDLAHGCHWTNVHDWEVIEPYLEDRVDGGVLQTKVGVRRVVEQLVELGLGVERVGSVGRRVGVDFPGRVPVLERNDNKIKQ